MSCFAWILYINRNRGKNNKHFFLSLSQLCCVGLDILKAYVYNRVERGAFEVRDMPK